MAELQTIPYTNTQAMAPPTEVDKVEQRRSRRLSKPRTNTNSASHGPLRSDLSIDDLSVVTRTAASSMTDLPLLSPTMDRHQLRHILREQLAQLDEESPIEETEYVKEKKNRRESTESHNPSVRSSRLQRTGTMLAKRLSVTTSAQRKSMSSTALNELGKGSGLMDETYDWIKEKARQDRIAMVKHVSKPDTEDVLDLLAPIRRRSLLTPGLATRGSDILRKQPPVSLLHNCSVTEWDLQDRYYNPDVSPESPLSRIISINMPQQRSSISLTTRASTPGDLDYGRIGGALRVTNGRPVSPCPSALLKPIAAPTPVSPARTIKPYLTAPEGERDDTGAAFPRENAKIDDDKMPSVPSLRVLDPYSEDAGNPWAHDNDAISEALTATKFIPETLIADPGTSTDCSTDSRPDCAAHEQPDYFNQPFTDLYDEPTHITLGSSLYQIQSCAGSRTSTLEPTTKLNEEDALLFEDESPILNVTTSDYEPSSSEVSLQCSKLEMARILDSMMAASRLSPVHLRADDASVYSCNPASATSEKPTFSLVDSGYNSGTSLTGISPASSLSRGNASATISRAPSGPRAARDHQSTVSSQEIDQALASPSTRPSTHKVKTTPTISTDSGARLSPMTASSATSTPSILIPESSRPSPSSRATIPMKLQKKSRPVSMPPPVDRIVVAGPSDSSTLSNIPLVPAGLVMRNAERHWESKPYEDREPTIPILPTEITSCSEAGMECGKVESRQRSHHFSIQSWTRNQTLTRPPATDRLPPPVPQKSYHRRSVSRKDVIRELRRPSMDSTIPPLPTFPLIEQPPQHEVPRGRQYSVDNTPMHSSHPYVFASRSRPAPAAISDIEDKEASDAPKKWGQYRHAWAAESAGETLYARPDLLTEDEEYQPAEEPAPNPPPVSPQHGPMPLPLPEHHSRPTTSYSEKRKSINFHLPMRTSPGATASGSAGTTPLSQPSAVPSPLKIAQHCSSTAQVMHHPGTSQESSYFANASAFTGIEHGSASPLGSGSGLSIVPMQMAVAAAASSGGGSSSSSSLHTRTRPTTSSYVAADRYAGGFGFGYEPNKGFFGSAGTRAAGDMATRKMGTGDLARGFGVDLSDVPIFVARG